MWCSKYGADHVAQIITFGTMAARAASPGRGTGLGMLGYQHGGHCGKADPQRAEHDHRQGAFRGARSSKSAMRAIRRSKELIDVSRKLEGMPRHASTHAAGVVITREPADDLCASRRRTTKPLSPSIP